MPCIFCERMYKKKPCVRDGKYDSEPTLRDPASLKDPWYSYYNTKEIKRIVTTFLLLHGYCPCEICLVKTMCKILCQEYEYRVIKVVE